MQQSWCFLQHGLGGRIYKVWFSLSLDLLLFTFFSVIFKRKRESIDAELEEDAAYLSEGRCMIMPQFSKGLLSSQGW